MRRNRGSGTLFTNDCAGKLFSVPELRISRECVALLGIFTGLDPSDSIFKDSEDKSQYNGFQHIATS